MLPVNIAKFEEHLLMAACLITYHALVNLLECANKSFHRKYFLVNFPKSKSLKSTFFLQTSKEETIS